MLKEQMSVCPVDGEKHVCVPLLSAYYPCRDCLYVARCDRPKVFDVGEMCPLKEFVNVKLSRRR